MNLLLILVLDRHSFSQLYCKVFYSLSRCALTHKFNHNALVYQFNVCARAQTSLHAADLLMSTVRIICCSYTNSHYSFGCFSSLLTPAFSRARDVLIGSHNYSTQAMEGSLSGHTHTREAPSVFYSYLYMTVFLDLEHLSLYRYLSFPYRGSFLVLSRRVSSILGVFSFIPPVSFIRKA